jgi:hypothetical protein
MTADHKAVHVRSLLTEGLQRAKIASVTRAKIKKVPLSLSLNPASYIAANIILNT